MTAPGCVRGDRYRIRFAIAPRRPPEDVLDGDCVGPRRRLVHISRAIGKPHAQATRLRRHIVVLIRIDLVAIRIESSCVAWQSDMDSERYGIGEKSAHSNLVDV